MKKFTAFIICSLAIFLFLSKESKAQYKQLLLYPYSLNLGSSLVEKISTSNTPIGRLGLGITDPQGYLHLEHTYNSGEVVYPLLKLHAISNKGGTPTNIGTINFFHQDDNSIVYSIYQTGYYCAYNYFQSKVGIGTTIPDYLLHVGGRIGCDSTICFTGEEPGIHFVSEPFTFSIQPGKSSYIAKPLALYQARVKVDDTLECKNFILKFNSGYGKVLISDSLGNGHWTDPSSFHDDDWLITRESDGFEPPSGSEMSSLYLNTTKYKSVLIGTGASIDGYILAINGKTICEELVVKLFNDWPDYVFENQYLLPSLYEI